MLKFFRKSEGEDCLDELYKEFHKDAPWKWWKLRRVIRKLLKSGASMSVNKLNELRETFLSLWDLAAQKHSIAVREMNLWNSLQFRLQRKGLMN